MCRAPPYIFCGVECERNRSLSKSLITICEKILSGIFQRCRAERMPIDIGSWWNNRMLGSLIKFHAIR